MRFYNTAFLTFTLLSACGYSSEQESSTKIIGGKEVPDNWQGLTSKSTVALATDKEILVGHSFCSGTVIGSNAVLTAAHCIDTAGEENFKISIGHNTLTNHWLSKKAVKVHENWKHYITTGKNDDVALVITKENFPDSVPRVQIARDITQGEAVRAAGFGLTRYDTNSTGILNYINLQVNSVDRETCSFEEYLPNKGIASGDSGGPNYVWRNGTLELAGVSSYAFIKHGVTTGKASIVLGECYIDWINKNIPKNSD